MVSKRNAIRLIFSVFFVITFFLSSCDTTSRKEDLFQLTKEEARDLEYFLNLLLFENHGAFVMLGSKPMSSMTLIDVERAEVLWEQKLSHMTSEEKLQWENALKEQKDAVGPGFRRNPYKGWRVWEKVSGQFESSRFIITVKPQSEESAFYDLLFVDVPKTAVVLAEHYEHFKSLIGGDFDPFGIVFDLEDPNSQFWNKVFQLDNHLAKGLLFGYGKKNALFFDCKIKHLKNEGLVSRKIMGMPTNRSFEEDVALGQGNIKNFTIPRFGMIDTDDVEKYWKEKGKIERYFRGKDILQATIAKIFPEQKSRDEK